MPIPSGVLFDLYGTLFVYGDMVKAWNDWTDDMHESLRAIGVELERAALARECDGFFKGSLEPFEDLTVYETRMRNLALRLGAKPGKPWCRAVATHSLVRWQGQVSLDPQAVPCLRRLRSASIRTGVLSNFDHYPHVHALLATAGLAPLLDAVVVSGEVGLKKPDPRIFQLALQRIGTEASRTVFVGDHPDQDFAGAQAAGLHPVLLQRSAEGVDRLHTDYRADLATGEDSDVQTQESPSARSLGEVLERILGAIKH